MDIVVEDGTGLANANSYISAADARTYAANRGIVLPAIPVITPEVPADPDADPPTEEVPAVYGDDPIIKWLVLAMDYLASLDYILLQASETQGLQWPRKAYFTQPTDKWLMPTKMSDAQAQLVIEQFNGVVLFPSTPGVAQGGGFVTRERVDVLETEYSEKIVPYGPDMPAVIAILRGLTTGGDTLRNVRV